MQSEAWRDARLRLNPSIYRPKQYVLPVQIGNEPEKIATGSLTINNLPFLLEFVTHGVKYCSDWAQDGNYSIIFSDQSYQFNKDWTLAPLMFGHSFLKNNVVPMTIPTVFRGSDALKMQVLNHRIWPLYSSSVVIEFTFHGFEKYGSSTGEKND